MKCPSCHEDNDRVIDSRASHDGFAIRRRRVCSIRANSEIAFCAVRSQDFNKNGKAVLDAPHTGYWYGRTASAGEIITIKQAFPKELGIVAVKGYIDVFRPGNEPWNLKHPVTFEARLKPKDEKAEALKPAAEKAKTEVKPSK